MLLTPVYIFIKVFVVFSVLFFYLYFLPLSVKMIFEIKKERSYLLSIDKDNINSEAYKQTSDNLFVSFLIIFVGAVIPILALFFTYFI